MLECYQSLVNIGTIYTIFIPFNNYVMMFAPTNGLLKNEGVRKNAMRKLSTEKLDKNGVCFAVYNVI